MASIRKIRHQLTDGSCVFNLLVTVTADTIELQCVTEADCDALARLFAKGLTEHTNETVTEKDMIDTVA